jgi:hypothetical protein
MLIEGTPTAEAHVCFEFVDRTESTACIRAYAGGFSRQHSLVTLRAAHRRGVAEARVGLGLRPPDFGAHRRRPFIIHAAAHAVIEFIALTHGPCRTFFVRIRPAAAGGTRPHVLVVEVARAAAEFHFVDSSLKLRGEAQAASNVTAYLRGFGITGPAARRRFAVRIEDLRLGADAGVL